MKKAQKKLYGRHAANMMKTDVKEQDDHYEVELKELLEKEGLSCTEDGRKAGEEQYHFFVSDCAENFTSFATAILPKEVKETKKINIEEY